MKDVGLMTVQELTDYLNASGVLAPLLATVQSGLDCTKRFISFSDSKEGLKSTHDPRSLRLALLMPLDDVPLALAKGALPGDDLPYSVWSFSVTPLLLQARLEGRLP